MTAGAPDWRDAEGYKQLRHVDRAGLMWEWLRRDQAYIAWYGRASRMTLGGGDDGPEHWGLHFR